MTKRQNIPALQQTRVRTPQERILKIKLRETMSDHHQINHVDGTNHNKIQQKETELKPHNAASWHCLISACTLKIAPESSKKRDCHLRDDDNNQVTQMYR